MNHLGINISSSIMNMSHLSTSYSKYAVAVIALFCVVSTLSCQNKVKQVAESEPFTIEIDSVEIRVTKIEGEKAQKLSGDLSMNYISHRGSSSVPFFVSYGLDLGKAFALALDIPASRLKNESKNLPKDFISLQLETKRDSLGDMFHLLEQVAHQHGAKLSKVLEPVEAFKIGLSDASLLQSKCTGDASMDRPMSTQRYAEVITYEHVSLAGFCSSLEEEFDDLVFLPLNDHETAQKRYSFSIPRSSFASLDELRSFLGKNLGLTLEATRIERDFLLIRDL